MKLIAVSSLLVHVCSASVTYTGNFNMAITYFRLKLKDFTDQNSVLSWLPKTKENLPKNKLKLVVTATLVYKLDIIRVLLRVVLILEIQDI